VFSGKFIFNEKIIKPETQSY